MPMSTVTTPTTRLPTRIGAELDIIVVLLTSSYAGSSQKTSFGP